jgi:membrane protease YdiL (CAAX protease family)
VTWVTALAILVVLPISNSRVLMPWVEHSHANRSTWWLNNVANVVQHLLVLGLAAVAVQRRELTPADAGFERPTPRQRRLLVGVIAVSLAGLALRQLGVLSAAQTTAFSPTTGPERLAFWAAGVVIGGVQEPLWRAFAFHALRHALHAPQLLAIAVTSASFGYFHGSLAQGGFTGLAALVLSWLYVRTRSIWWPIIVHVAFNAGLAPFG